MYEIVWCTVYCFTIFIVSFTQKSNTRFPQRTKEMHAKEIIITLIKAAKITGTGATWASPNAIMNNFSFIQQNGFFENKDGALCED